MFLKRLEIENLRSIEHLALDFVQGDGQVRRRTLLLGENGCGKSTALRAAALLLAGGDALTDLLKEPERWVRNGRAAARLAATLTTQGGQERRIALTLRRTWSLRETLKHNEKSLSDLDRALAHTPRNYFVMGYGVTRRPASGDREFSQAADRAYAHPRARAVATLFAPEAALVSFEQWAMDMDYGEGPGAMRALRSAITGLLPGMKLERIDRRRREVVFRTADGAVPFRQLSDGYQNVANWCGDMLYRITTTFQDYRAPLHTRGLLIIDELDLHLHPTWQRGLMEFLEKALPNLQILATSHSPIIAQQLREGELYVIERPSAKQGATMRAVAGDPSRLSLPQLLSPMFGIDTADSLRVQRLRERSRRGRATAALRAELADVAPLDALPRAMREQIRAAEEVTHALSKVAGVAAPRLDPARLRARVGERIRLGPNKR